MDPKTINFKGEIVDSHYDCEFLADYFNKGIITSASRLVPEFDAMQKGDVASVFVDSPGGDVFEGDKIVIAALKALERGAEISVEIGSEACSMAANFMVAMKVAGAKVVAHANSKIMFHSAFVGVTGGAQLLEDRAALIRGINSTVIENLKKCGVADCESWFDESREMHMMGRDAVEMGIATELAEGDAAALDVKAALADFRAAALKVDEPAPVATEPAAQGETEVKAEATKPAEPTENWKERYAGASKKINALQEELAAVKAAQDGAIKLAVGDAIKDFKDKLEQSAKDLAAATAQVSELGAKLEDATKDLAATRERAEVAEKARALLTGNGIFNPAENGDDYAAKMAKAKTAEERESLRAMKRAGKIK